MIFKKYFAALISVAIVVLTALLAVPTGEIQGAAIAQLVAIGAGAVATYFLPLVDISWRGVLKTGAAAIAAVVSILVPILEAHGIPNSTQVALMVLAVVNALGVEIGVNIRTDTSDLFVVQDPTPTEVARTNSIDIVAETPAPWTPPVVEAPVAEPAPVTAGVNLANQQDQTTSINTANLSE